MQLERYRSLNRWRAVDQLASENRRGLLRNWLCVQDCGKAEVVALELWIPHLAVVAEVDATKAAAETLDVTVREL